MIQSEINEHLLEWERTTRIFRREAAEAATHKARWEHERAQKMRRLIHGEERLSKAAAEVEADADDEIFRLRLDMLRAEATADSTGKRLVWCRSKADALRSEKVDERESNRLYSENPAGA